MSGHHVQSRLRFCQTLFNDHRLIFAALLKGYRIEQFQKIPNTIPWMAFRNSKGKREFFELGMQRHGGYLRLEFRRHGGVQDLEFPQGTDKSVFLENTYLMDFYYNQFKNKARTDEDADTHKHPSIWHVLVFIC